MEPMAPTGPTAPEVSRLVFGNSHMFGVMVEIASLRGQTFSSKQISDATQLSPGIVHPLIQKLRRAHFIEFVEQVHGERTLLYRVIDNRSAADLIDSLKARENLRDCNGCELDIGKSLGADVIVVGWVQKVSNLILNINLQLKDVQSGEMLYAKSVDLRSNTDDSWLRGIRYLVTSMAEETQGTH